MTRPETLDQEEKRAVWLLARQKARGMKAANLMETAVAGWIMMTEERTARNYWVHVDTGEITWEKPTEVAEREAQMADQAMKAAREAAAASKSGGAKSAQAVPGAS